MFGLGEVPCLHYVRFCVCTRSTSIVGWVYSTLRYDTEFWCSGYSVTVFMPQQEGHGVREVVDLCKELQHTGKMDYDILTSRICQVWSCLEKESEQKKLKVLE